MSSPVPALNKELTISVVIPTLNEENYVWTLLQYLLTECSPPPNEIVVSDCASADKTVQIVRTIADDYPQLKIVTFAGNATVDPPNRASTQNAGLFAATGDFVIFVHADTLPPRDFSDHVRRALQHPSTSLGAFRPLLTDGQSINWVITIQHIAKTYYGPAIAHPWLMWKNGGLCFFGDQCIFGRRSELISVGGFDCVPIFEEASLCHKISARYGRCKMVSAYCRTSDRRFKYYSTLYLMCVMLIIGFSAELGIVPLRLLRALYPPQHIVERNYLRRRTSWRAWLGLDY